MRVGPVLLATVLSFIAFAGCLSDAVDDVTIESATYDAESERYVQQLGTNLELRWAPGAISTITSAEDHGTQVTVPFGWLEIVKTENGGKAFSLPDGPLSFGREQTRTFLAPPNTEPVSFIVDSQLVSNEIWNLEIPDVGADPEDEIISGENVWDLSAHQEAHYPHRKVFMSAEEGGNYWTSMEYFASYFESLGLEVEVDPYDTETATQDGTACAPESTNDVPASTPYVNTRGVCPGSAANVVATLHGTDPDAPIIFVSGGHFDMVEQTTHAAFDDTSGTVSTLELARVMSQFEWKHTLMFGLWGGEEDGIVGSQFWVRSNPDLHSRITTYWNLDVVGMSWPTPLVKPDPIVIAAGPDAPSDAQGGAAGPIADALLLHAEDLQEAWFGYPETTDDGDQIWYYEGIGSGQAQGYAGVNAQSDHTPFMAAGIPAFFIFNGDALAGDNPIGIHNERDTLENMTRYAYFGGEETLRIMTEETDKGQQYEWNPAEYEAAKAALADSWEVVLFFPLYSAVLQDLGYWYSPGTAGQAEQQRQADGP